ncbi:MAG: MBL fold metallo-hydrolase [Anaerolineae bacterium]|nr:MBL fold metallo-hydrolase [Anaerolineae bacterium]
MSEAPRSYAPGVYGLVGGAVNLYVLDDEAGVTIIDAGLPGSTKRIVDLLRAIGRSPSDVKHILVTHADIDHVGSLRPLVKATGAPVYASAETQRYIKRRGVPPHVRFPLSLVSRVMVLVIGGGIKDGQVVAGGDRLDIAGGIRVIATPGHTPDHVSYFWERERVLFAGDLLKHGQRAYPVTPGGHMEPGRYT